MRRTHPTSNDRTASTRSVPDHALGGAAADVDDEERAVARVEVGGGAGEAELALLLAAQQLGARADDGLGGGEEVVRVGGVPGRRGGGDPHLGDAVLVHGGPVVAQHVDGPLDRLGVEPARSRRRRARAG